MNHYPHHIGDFAKDTLGLNQGAIGAYRLLMDAYYGNERGPSVDEVYVIGRATTPAERKNVDKALEKFELRDGRYYHKRIEEEIATYRAKAEHNKRVGKSGGRPKRNPEPNPTHNPEETRMVSTTEPKPNPEITLANSQEPITKPSEREFPGDGDIPANPPPIARSRVEAPEDRVRSLAAICTASWVKNATTGSLYVQQWAADGITDDQLRDAIAMAREIKPLPEQLYPKYLLPIVEKVRAGAVPKALSHADVVARTIASLAAKEANATH